MQAKEIQYMNKLGKDRIPFVFIIDFDCSMPMIFPLDEIPSEIKFKTPGFSNISDKRIQKLAPFEFQKQPISFENYSKAFHAVKEEIIYGNSYLLNLTFPTSVSTKLSLNQIFTNSTAPYKLYIKDQFVCFSPEIFVTMQNGLISSFPMKGTIDANLEDAANLLLNDEKEKAEHATIVDLIRNDLSMVATEVNVKRYRYLEEIKTRSGNLLQMSSEITGQLPKDYHEHIGDILAKILPAGSITGAPKQKTLEIIKQNENYKRGFYTGIFGVFNGWDLESAVMIRFIEKTNNGLIFKSGGGITAMSDCQSEYEEMISKVYVPIT